MTMIQRNSLRTTLHNIADLTVSVAVDTATNAPANVEAVARVCAKNYLQRLADAIVRNACRPPTVRDIVSELWQKFPGAAERILQQPDMKAVLFLVQ